MAALNVMDGRTERGERFFFELMRHGKRGARRAKSYDSRNIIPERRRCARERRDNNKRDSVMKLLAVNERRSRGPRISHEDASVSDKCID